VKKHIYAYRYIGSKYKKQFVSRKILRVCLFLEHTPKYSYYLVWDPAWAALFSSLSFPNFPKQPGFLHEIFLRTMLRDYTKAKNIAKKEIGLQRPSSSTYFLRGRCKTGQRRNKGMQIGETSAKKAGWEKRVRKGIN
jgi:hypothetical protein